MPHQFKQLVLRDHLTSAQTWQQGYLPIRSRRQTCSLQFYSEKTTDGSGADGEFALRVPSGHNGLAGPGNLC